MNIQKYSFLALALTATLGASAATTYYVSEVYGDDRNDGTSWETPLKTLTAFTGEAPTKSLAGNTVVISNGTYKISGPIYMNSLSSFRGFSSNPADTVIDGQGLTPVFYLAYASGNQMGTVHNLTVQGGFLESGSQPAFRTFGGGAGIFMGNDARNVVSNCIVRDCHVKVNTSTFLRGGGVYCNQGKLYDLVISNCTISAAAEKAKAYGGGLYTDGGTICDGLFIADCQAKAVSGSDTDAFGGGLYTGVTGTAKRTRITGCAAVRGGGACFTAAGTYGNYLIENCSATGAGGGVSLLDSITLATSTVTNCTATTGGGLYLAFDDSTVTNCLIAANNATGAGGGGIYCENGRSNVAIADSVIRGNTSANAGAAVQFGSYRFNTVSIIRCVIENNTASGYGALTSSSSCYNSKLWDCIVTGNTGNHLLYSYSNPGEYPTAGVKEWWIRNCYIARNNTTFLGLFNLSNIPSKGTYSIVDHCTIVDNNKASGSTDKYVFSAHAGWGTALFGTNNYMSANVIYNNGGNNNNFNLDSSDLVPNVKCNYTTGVPMAAQGNYDPSALLPGQQFADWTSGDWRIKKPAALVDQDTTAVCDCAWMKGADATDLGDGTYTLERVGDNGVHVVFNNARKRWVGNFPDIGCFEHWRRLTGAALILR